MGKTDFLMITIYPAMLPFTVKPVLRGHFWDKERVVLWYRWPLERGSIHIKFTMSGQGDLLIQVAA